MPETVARNSKEAKRFFLTHKKGETVSLLGADGKTKKGCDLYRDAVAFFEEHGELKRGMKPKTQNG